MLRDNVTIVTDFSFIAKVVLLTIYKADPGLYVPTLGNSIV